MISTFQGLTDWIKKNKIKELIIPYETVGSKIVSTREFLNNLGSIGVKYHFYLRDWDKISFPFANKGFFHLRKKYLKLIIKNGLSNILEKIFNFKIFSTQYLFVLIVLFENYI